MFNWIKKNFIPHIDNNYHPHLLRKDITRSLILIIICVEILVFVFPLFSRIHMRGGMASVLPAVLSSLVNEKRVENNLDTLVVNPVLNKAAEMKAIHMAENGYFAHTSPDGKTPWYWLRLVGYSYKYAGENLAINFFDSEGVASAWMESPTHKANIEKINYTEIGTGMALGILDGEETTFVVQIYASPASSIKKEKQAISPNASEKFENVLTGGARVLGAEVVNEDNLKFLEPSLISKVLSSPQKTTKIFFYLLGCVIFITLTLVFLKKFHPNAALNGLILLLILIIFTSFNYYISMQNISILNEMDFSFLE